MTSSAFKTVGRYAPSPTGDLHLGNLRTAMLAWLHARLAGGEFIVRMEDLDTPRVVLGSADQILRDLEWLGLDWDGTVVYQSKRTVLYQEALADLTDRGFTYKCFCSRKDIQAAASAPHGSVAVYPGTCRGLSERQIKQREFKKQPAIRVKVDDCLSVDDSRRVDDSVLEKMGDFVVKRADTLFAYQLAVTVDDLEQGVTEVVRGADLLDSTPKQQYLAALLQPAAPAINYLHVPLMLDDCGHRMSKRDGSISATSWRQESKSAEQLLGYLAFSVGIVDENKAFNKEELIDRISESLSFSKLAIFA